jgi:prepilin-type N-terminal cleavage/methylation domain-containing protein
MRIPGRGFTLPELLVSMFCLSIILVAFTGFFLSSMKNYSVINAQQDVQSNAVLAVDSIMRDFKETSKNTNEIVADCSGATQHFLYFPSPRDWRTGDYSIHQADTPWPSWILYYQTLDPKVQPPEPDSYVLVRIQQQDMPVSASIPTLSSRQVRGRVVARSINSFSAQADLLATPQKYSIVVTTRRFWKNASYDFSIQKTLFVNDLHNF